MTETTNIRKERIVKLLHELRYEIERGMIEGEIGENLIFDFYVPISKLLPGGVVHCQFQTRPTQIPIDVMSPRLKIVK